MSSPPSHPIAASSNSGSVRIDDQSFAGNIDASALAMRAFLMGPLGATIAGSYLLQAFVVAIPFRVRQAWAWHAVL
ncbi:MAG: hypothetical protein VCB25_00440 [Myxococcota bacterium]